MITYFYTSEIHHMKLESSKMKKGTKIELKKIKQNAFNSPIERMLDIKNPKS